MMKSRTRRKPFFRILLGLILFVTGAVLAVHHSIQGGEIVGLMLGGWLVYLWGCAAHARAQGYSAGQGILLGLVFPALPILIMSDRTKLPKAEREKLEREEKDEAAADLRAKRTPLHGPKKFFAALIGIFFIALGAAIVTGYQIYWNRVVVPESNRLAEAVPIDAGKIIPENEGKLVHVTGLLAGATNLTDADFSLSTNALSLRRRVWMYQWQERGRKGSFSSGTIDSQGNSKTDYKIIVYDYDKVWSEKIINSRTFHNVTVNSKPLNNFGHDNPAEMKISSRTVTAPDISLGAFAVAPELSAQLDNYQPVSPNETNLATLPESLRANASLADGGIFFGQNFSQPAIGDLKVKFESAPPATVSIIARQSGNSLSAYSLPDTGSLALLKVGTFSVPEMTAQFAKTNSQARLLVWIAGGALVAFGFLMVAIARRK